MACGCARLTVRHACRHKTRSIYRCFFYSFRREHPCVGSCFPACRPIVEKAEDDWVCHHCEKYFAESFGRRKVKAVVRRFLEYKTIKGWEKQAIMPETVPRELYTSANPVAGHRGQPFCVQSPMRPTHLQAPPQAHTQVGRRRGQPSEAFQKPISDCSFDLAANGALPNDYGASTSNLEMAAPYPVVEYGTGEPIDLQDLVDDDVDDDDDYYGQYLAEGLKKREQRNKMGLTPKVEADVDHAAYMGTPYRASIIIPQPRGKDLVPKKKRSLKDAISNCTLVKRFDARAEIIEIKGYPNPAIPIISEAPTTPSWRRPDTPVPCKAEGETEAAAPSGRRGPPLPALQTAPARYFVIAESDPTSSTGAAAHVRSSPSHERIAVPPPQRLDGVLVPACSGHGTSYAFDCQDCRHSFFQERGLPSDAYRLECRSAPPVLVSVSTPVPNYSCAVQATCYCRGGVDDKCPPCQERERLAAEMHMEWI